MTSPVSIAAPVRRLWFWGRLSVAIFILVAAVAASLGVGRWLLVEDPLQKANAIVVLSGRMPMRAREAATLYKEGWAPQVWVAKPAGADRELETMSIPYVGEEFYSQRVLIHFGVPVDSIRVLEPEVENTADEMDTIAKTLERNRGSSVILVTTKAHTRRVRTLWRMRAKAGMRAVVRGARDDPFDPAHWWRTSTDALDVVREVLGLANAWAGLPLKPGS